MGKIVAWAPSCWDNGFFRFETCQGKKSTFPAEPQKFQNHTTVFQFFVGRRPNLLAMKFIFFAILWFLTTSPLLCAAQNSLRSSSASAREPEETQQQHEDSTTKKQKRRLASPDLRYKLYSINEIETQVKALANSYPNLIKVTTSQKEYGLAAAGGYVNYILTIQDYVVHPEGSDSSNRLPEVFFSGALHGDERVGPTVTVETAKLLLRAASCESNPTAACQNSLAALGVKASYRQWLARLVTTRRIIIVPNANALGYAQNVREENGIDPNRDFAYDPEPKTPTKCMQSIAARTLNEVWREHQFQLAITFHGGMEVRYDELIGHRLLSRFRGGSFCFVFHSHTSIIHGFSLASGHFLRMGCHLVRINVVSLPR